MIPILYRGDETEFTSNGLGRLTDCISCTVTEERNGIYECAFRYPVTGRLYSKITDSSIIGVTHDDAHDIQPFDIYGRSAPIDGIVTFYAHHISYRLGHIILKPFTASSCATAIAAMATQTYNDNPFTFWTDKSTSGEYTVSAPVAVKAMLGGQAGSLLDVYGTGEYQWDKWAVRLYAARGVDKGVAIRYGVNLTNVVQDVDTSGSYSAVAPYWTAGDGSGTTVTLPEGYILSSQLRTVLYPIQDNNLDDLTDENGNVIEGYNALVLPVPLDLSSEFTEEPTVEQLRAKAQSVLANSRAWLPNENIRVDFVALWQTEQYANVAALQRVQLCDRVSVYANQIGVNAVSMEVVKTVYNVLLDRFDAIELGNAQTTFADVVSAQVGTDLRRTLVSQSILARSIKHATDMITGGLGGFLVINTNAAGEPEELLIMDTPDKETAVNVWRFNSGGLGHSHNGYEGPFDDVALTADGQINATLITTGILNANLIQAGAINADLITTGTINGDLIRAGLISDYQNNNYWNLATGYFTTKRGTIANFTIGSTSIYSGSFDPDTTGGVNINDGYIAVAYDAQSNDLRYKMRITGYGINLDRSTGSTWSFVGGLWVSESEENGTKYAYAQLSSIGSTLSIGTSSSNPNGYARVSNDLLVPGIAYITGDLRVGGSKSRQVSTSAYSDRLLYAYETPSPMFGDVGEGTISDDGLCYVWIDPVFAETISDGQYQVFLQRYGEGDCFVIERRAGCFVVHGTPGLAFGWELKARQRDYEQTRLDTPELIYSPGTVDYGALAQQHIQTIQEARNVT